jgi:hypothetical protein
MELFFEFVHLDPASDPPEHYLAAFEMLGDIWGQLHAFRSACPQDEFLSQLITHLENQLVATGLVLTIKIETLSRP